MSGILKLGLNEACEFHVVCLLFSLSGYPMVEYGFIFPMHFDVGFGRLWGSAKQLASETCLNSCLPIKG